MPKIPNKQDLYLNAALALWREFEDPAAWHTSKKNESNICRDWEGRLLVVFKRNGRYGWSIRDEDGVTQFSKRTYDEQEHARSALGEEVGVGL